MAAGKHPRWGAEGSHVRQADVLTCKSTEATLGASWTQKGVDRSRWPAGGLGCASPAGFHAAVHPTPVQQGLLPVPPPVTAQYTGPLWVGVESLPGAQREVPGDRNRALGEVMATASSQSLQFSSTSCNLPEIASPAIRAHIHPNQVSRAIETESYLKVTFYAGGTGH